MEGGQADFEGSQFCALEMEMQRTLLTRSLHVTQGQGRYFAVNGILLVRCMVVETSPPRTRLEHQPFCCLFFLSLRKTTLVSQVGAQTPEQPHPRGRAAGLDSDSLRMGLDGRTSIRSSGVGAGRRKHARCECASMVFPFDARRASVRWYWHR